MYPATVTERLLAAEGEIHLLQRAVAGQAEHHLVVGVKLDDLSGQARALEHEVRTVEHEVRTEVVPRLDQIDERLGRIEGDVSELKSDVSELNGRMTGVEAGVSALLAHFNIIPPSA